MLLTLPSQGKAAQFRVQPPVEFEGSTLHLPSLSGSPAELEASK